MNSGRIEQFSLRDLERDAITVDEVEPEVVSISPRDYALSVLLHTRFGLDSDVVTNALGRIRGQVANCSRNPGLAKNVAANLLAEDYNLEEIYDYKDVVAGFVTDCLERPKVVDRSADGGMQVVA